MNCHSCRKSWPTNLEEIKPDTVYRYRKFYSSYCHNCNEKNFFIKERGVVRRWGKSIGKIGPYLNCTPKQVAATISVLELFRASAFFIYKKIEDTWGLNCVYFWVPTVGNITYIGQSIDFRKRMQKHNQRGFWEKETMIVAPIEPSFTEYTNYLDRAEMALVGIHYPIKNKDKKLAKGRRG